ncbi:TMV resistance protein N isoform X1 [Cajanus cajan]|uniref:TMV resistance protein N isoform X1 n=2 Tax=Cajanus cajan TaxID=3821 RepID=UPI00098DA7DF|nr:TMV resistance protein N isoform X1 [Cajanus cajan]XP_020236376.1 TMV resistance protein N isoform X1 [Cajanus cajan]XP_020236377.1 TMV resistance protein N isoform X1 [Cajanus cajan]XP_029130736.1 TMV resistance protein N isoform X1 [Cajanus cajan]
MMKQRLCYSSSTCEWTYDVFLSFRGEDTRSGFTGNLYRSLCDRGIHTFIDDVELSRGEMITPALFKAIEQSRIAIVVFSENYASSAYCLEELVIILECIMKKGRLVWPVFYGVSPSYVRNQEGSYGEALAKLGERFKNDEERLRKWKLALKEAANLSGFHFMFKHGYEYKFIQTIVEEVSRKINRSPLHVANYPIGLESRVQEVKSLLDVGSNQGVSMVGIYGIGGIGKTTITCALYNCIADQFEGQCFLADIRENSMKYGLVQLQETILSEMVGEKSIKLGSINRGMAVLKSKLQRKKVLLILDDVDKMEQFNALAGDLSWFGYGSKIIVTTRNKHLLHVRGVERTYEAKGLDHKEALELFSWHAFKSNEVGPSYMDVSKRAILYSNGLPLALEIIGSNLCGKTMSEWIAALDTYERIPDEDIQEKLKVSYDGLKRNEKEVFLDIACFFRGYILKDVISLLLQGRGFSPEYVIRVLIDRSLIKIDQCGFVRMHNLVEDMGREIVRQESPSEPGKRSRLWLYEDIVDVLENDKGTETIEVIMLHLPKSKDVRWNGSELKKMTNLKILTIENAYFSRGPEHLPNSLRVLKWWGYPSQSLPPEFDPKRLVMVDLSMSCNFLGKQLEHMKFESLSEMVLRGCRFMKKVPDMSGAQNLMKLCLDHCKNLVEVHDSVGLLDKLTRFTAIGCTNLRFLPHNFKLTSLEHLSLRKCSSLHYLPNILEDMEHIKNLDLCGTAIEELPFSFRKLTGLKYLVLDKCKKLYQIPISILMLPKLERLTAVKCGRHVNLILGKNELASSKPLMKDVRLSYNDLTPVSHSNVEFLDLTASAFKVLPECISQCRFLKYLVMDNCKKLQEIRGVPPKIKYLSAINCTSLNHMSQSMLLNQRLHEGGGTDFSLPGTRIPEWFDHCVVGPSLSFWFRHKFPKMALAVVGVLDQQGSFPTSRFHLVINSIQKLHCNFTVQSKLITYHIFLSDVQLKSYNGELESVYGDDGWNHVEISYVGPMVFPHSCKSKKGIIKWMGVHVYKKKTTVEDVRFTNPRSPKRAYSEVSKSGLNGNFQPLPKRSRLSQGMGIWEASHMKQHEGNSGYHGVSQRLWSAICSIAAPLHVKVLMWNSCQDALPTCEYLFRRKLVDSPLCPICGTVPETIEHVFLFCPWTQPLWFGSDFQWCIDVNTVQSFQLWLCQKLVEINRVYLENASQAFALVGSICWAIWKGRNEFVHEGKPVNPLILRKEKF